MSKTEFLGLEAQSGNDLLQLNSGVGVNMQLIDEYAKQTSAKIGDTSTLQTTYKDSIVGALNEVINTIPDLGGTNLLNATNELVTIGESSNWLERTWRYAKSSLTPNSTGTQAVFAVSDAPNPQIKYGFEIHNDSGRRFIAQDNIPLVTGATYTLSCYARATAGSPKLVLQTGGNTGGYNTHVMETTDSWKKYTMTFAARADAESAYFGCDGTDATLQICGEKLETGDYATDWSYSPNDIDARNAEKLDKSKVIESTEITEPGFVMDGKTCSAALAELNSKLLYEEAAFGDLIDTYSRVGLFSGFRLFKVGRIAHLQFGFYNKVALSAGHFFVKLPQAYRPISTIQLFDLSDDIKYRLDTDGVMYAIKSIDANTATRIITTYYCAE